MMKSIFALLALFATASAFAPVSHNAVKQAVAPLSMAMQTSEVQNKVMAGIAGFVPATLISTAAMATDGTGEWFGVDDLRLLGVLFVVHWAILGLWLQQFGDADEEEDFFGEIDYTQAKK